MINISKNVLLKFLKLVLRNYDKIILAHIELLYLRIVT